MSEVNENTRNILHKKEDVCKKLEQLALAQNINYQAEIEFLVGEYDNAGTLPPEYAELLDKKFAIAVAAAKAGETAYREKQQQISKLENDVNALIAAGDLATLNEVEKLIKSISELTTPSNPLIEKLAPLKIQLEAEEAAVKAAETSVLALAAELAELCSNEDITPLKERKPQIEAEFAQLANIPRKAALQYNDAHRKASVKLAQHYETLDLARWENYTRKLDVCAELKKLLSLPEEELPSASAKLNSLREQWKNLGSVPKERSEEINPEYLDLTRKLQHRIDEFFARKRQMQKISATEKEQLCTEAEALADSTDWKNTAEKMRELQAKWKTLPRAGNRENELFQRFRSAQDKFFNTRKAVFDERSRKFSESQSRKEELIIEAENLTDPRRARELRAEFRNAGFAGKCDQELFQAFNTAMDNFFNARKAEYASKENKARELISEVEKLIASPVESIARVREIREELKNLSCRETRQDEQNVLRKFDNALNEARQLEQRKREENSDSIAMTLATAYDCWQNGDTPAVPDDTALAGFAKLQNIAKLLREAVAGDEKSAAKLDKQIIAARNDRERICSELEKLSGRQNSDSGVIDLAAELQSAMLGDFGKGQSVSASSNAADPQQLCAEFASAGIVPAAELAEFQKRFADAKAIIFPAK